MPTVRTEADLLEIDDDPGEQKKTQDLLYDTIVTVFSEFKTKAAYPSPRSLLDFDADAGFGNTAAKAAANTRAWEDWVLNSNESLWVPPDPDGVGFFFDALEPPRRSIYGAGATGSKITAASGFTARSDTFLDMYSFGSAGANGAQSFGQEISGLQINSGGVINYTMGIDENLAAGASWTGTHVFSRLQLQGSGPAGYQVVGLTGIAGGSWITGTTWINCSIRASGGAGLIKLDNAADDVTFISPRLEMLGGEMDQWPILIDESVNIRFYAPFFRNSTDFKSGAVGDAIVRTQSGSRPILWDGGFMEIKEITYDNLRHMFRIGSGGATIKNVDLRGGSPAPTFTNGSFCQVLFDGYLRLEDITMDTTFVGMDSLMELNSNGVRTEAGRKSINVSGCEGTFTNLYRDDPDSVSSVGTALVHIVGEHAGHTYDHFISHDGTNLIPTDQRQVVADVTFAAGTATVAGAGTAVKVVATTTQKGDASGFTVGTDNTLTTLKPGLRRYRVWARFLVDIASGTDNVTLHVYSSSASIFETAAQSITATTAKLFEIDVVLDVDISKTIEIYAENEDAVVNVTTAAYAERVDTTPAHGFLRVSQV